MGISSGTSAYRVWSPSVKMRHRFHPRLDSPCLRRTQLSGMHCRAKSKGRSRR
ncbi:Uncharacterised protein [Mycobacterium tuberculosis]|nr:Uncharacterised protein [Mycobacterium tuberculosis]